jgi:hypothetical protein
MTAGLRAFVDLIREQQKSAGATKTGSRAKTTRPRAGRS